MIGTIGQINLGSNFGNLIYSISSRADVKNIVELGTWNGMGSTMCVVKTLIDNIDKNFHSIELYPDMFLIAKKNLSQYLDLPNFHLLNGRIIEKDDVYWFDHNSIQFGSDEHARLYYKSDIEYLQSAQNVLELLPKSIDFLILDGGEYTTYPEWHILKDRTRIVALDDTAVLKCAKIREELLNDENYRVISDDLNDRNGFSIFEKI